MYVGNKITFEDGNRMIKVTKTVVEMIRHQLQITSDSPEAGGILVGRENVSNDNFIIEYATSPMPGDIQKRTRYIRKDKDHLIFYQDLYDRYNGIYRYVGEWHTHPEKIPRYSIMDWNNWKKIAQNDNRNEFHYHFIAGTEAIRIWKIKCRSGLCPKLICTAYWRKSMI